MPFVFADRVKETSTTFGLGDFTLDGAVFGFGTFATEVGDGNTCFYTIVHDTDGTWESGVATIVAPNILQRTTVNKSSDAGNAPINFAAGAKTVFSGPNAQAFIERLTEDDHALINHSAILGVPGPETFTEADHNDPGFTHAGLPGVPDPETFINSNGEGDHVTTDHAGLPGIPIISAPSPLTYNVNRVITGTTVDLTAATEGIHFISLEAAGSDFGLLQVDIPVAPADDTPFYVIFNEDADGKGGVLAIYSDGQEITYLNPQEGIRLWHAGSLVNEWRVERIDPGDLVSSEVMYRWVGDTQVAGDFFRTYNSFPVNLASRDLVETERPVLTDTRFSKLAWRSDNTGAGVASELSFLDEAGSIIEQASLPSGITGIVDVDFTVTPDLSTSPSVAERVALRQDSGGDKNDVYLHAYGYQRLGGHELAFSGNMNFPGLFDMHASPCERTNGNSALGSGESYYRVPADGLLDRIVFLTDNVATFDLTIRLDGLDAETIVGLSSNATDASHVQLGSGIRVTKGSQIGLRIENPSAALGLHRIWIRVRGARGLLLPFASNSGFLDAFGRATQASGDVDEYTLVAPIDLRLYRWTISTDHNFTGGDDVVVSRNGVEVSRYEPTTGGGGSVNIDPVIETSGILFSEGQTITVDMNGFSTAMNVLLHMTAEPRVNL